MRNIKFRQWYDNGMRYMPEFYAGVGQVGWSDAHYVDLGMHDKEDCVLMQYTGLKDKNDTEIYEGDIITHEVNNLIGVVVFGTYGFVIENLKQTEIIADLSEYDYNPVIVGNIYENKELLA